MGITGGNVTMKIGLGRPPLGASFSEKMKRTAAYLSAGSHVTREALCQHLMRTHNDSRMNCPVAVGTQELQFSFARLPKMVVAGEYRVNVTAVDELGKPVVCVTGALNVPRGKKGQLFRRVEETAEASVSVGIGPSHTTFVGMFLAAIVKSLTM